MYIHNKLDLSNVIVFNLIDANKYQYQYQVNVAHCYAQYVYCSFLHL